MCYLCCVCMFVLFVYLPMKITPTKLCLFVVVLSCYFDIILLSIIPSGTPPSLLRHADAAGRRAAGRGPLHRHHLPHCVLLSLTKPC